MPVKKKIKSQKVPNKIDKNSKTSLDKIQSDVDKIKLKKHSKSPETDDNTADSNISIFKKQLRKIRRNTDKNTLQDKQHAMILMALRDMLLDLIPITEERYRKFKQERTSYALNHYTSQLREIMNDLRLSEDFQSRSNHINQMVREAYGLVFQNLVDELTNALGNVKMQDNLKEADVKAIEGFLKVVARNSQGYLKDSFENLSQRIENYLVFKPEIKKISPRKGS